RLRASALPIVGAGGRRAGRGRARSGGARTWPQSIRLLPAAARGRAVRALGAEDRRCEAQTRILSQRGQARPVQGGYISDRSGHSRGSTVDLTLVRRADARELDMGSPFDFFSPKSWPSDTSVSDQAQTNRALLAAAMIRGGFRPYDKEWWHFTLNNE